MLGVLNRFCLAEICNLSFGISKFFQDLAGMLAQHGCAMANFRRRGRQAYGWRGKWNWSRRSREFDLLQQATRFYLRIGKHLPRIKHRPGRDPCGFQFGDGLSGAAGREPSVHGFSNGSVVVGALLIADEARVGYEFLMSHKASPAGKHLISYD